MDLHLDVSETRRQVLAHLRQHHALEGLHVHDGPPRPCRVEHVLSADGEDDLELAQLTPLRLTYTDEAGGTAMWSWEDLHAFAYVKASPMRMMLFPGFAFQPRVFGTAPSLGARDATPAELHGALRALGGASTPVLATVEGEDGTDRRERLELKPIWREEEEGGEDQPVVRLELSPSPVNADDEASRAPTPVGFATVWKMVVTDNMAAPGLVRHIQGARHAASQS